MNISRSILQRRRLIQSGSVLALGAATSLLTGRKLLSVPRRRPAPTPSMVSVEPPILDPDLPELLLPEPLLIDPGGEPETAVLHPNRALEHEDRYFAFLSSLELRHLSPQEIIDPHRGIVNGVENSLPPERMWEKLEPTLRVADEIRERLELPLCRITSGYRAPDYNAVVPGAVRGSYHTRNQALDLVYFCTARKAYNMAVKLRNERFFRGGIGLYPTFIHLDTRGYAATWKRI
ncbi:MAG: D-Ala-D-Ala carboxypeptidase family metallohydrolase [Akkermansiaceae bacterium]